MCLIKICYNNGCAVTDSLYTLGQYDLYSSCLCGYLDSFVGEILYAEQETCNAEDHFTVAIVKAETIYH